MTTLREAAQQALEALESLHSEQNGPPLTRRSEEWGVAMTDAARAITTIRKALDADSMASLPEPVAWNWMLGGFVYGPAYSGRPPDEDIVKASEATGRTVRLLYAHPPKREWQGLTDDEIWSDGSQMGLWEDGIRRFAREIEAKLKEKNA